MRIHLIAIGGAVMHNLALALQANGHDVSGSDDEIYNPARDRLSEAGLLPPQFGWFPQKITPDLDFVILGMHARADNPELAAALRMNIPVYSFPEFIYHHSKDKTRIVVAGSHGKTTTTAIIMHIFKGANLDFDYLVGSQLEGFGHMVRLSDAPLMVIEGDEYLSSALDRRSKFLHYKPHIAIITGIAWDHINVFPSFAAYCDAFRQFIHSIEPGGHLIFYRKDKTLSEMVQSIRANLQVIPYQEFESRIKDGHTLIKRLHAAPVSLQIFGSHNLANLHAAYHVGLLCGVEEDTFWEHAATFRGAARRLQPLVTRADFAVWLDFAHAPSKVKATVQAVRQQFPGWQLIACLELQTFSSLNKDFLPQYAQTLNEADVAVVFYSPHTLEMKKMPTLSPDDIRAAFERPDLQVITEPMVLADYLREVPRHQTQLLLMSSGNFGGIDLEMLKT